MHVSSSSRTSRQREKSKTLTGNNSGEEQPNAEKSQKTEGSCQDSLIERINNPTTTIAELQEITHYSSIWPDFTIVAKAAQTEIDTRYISAFLQNSNIITAAEACQNINDLFLKTMLLKKWSTLAESFEDINHVLVYISRFEKYFEKTAVKVQKDMLYSKLNLLYMNNLQEYNASTELRTALDTMPSVYKEGAGAEVFETYLSKLRRLCMLDILMANSLKALSSINREIVNQFEDAKAEYDNRYSSLCKEKALKLKYKNQRKNKNL